MRFYDIDGVDMVRLFSCRISFAKLVMLVVSYLNGVDWVYGMLYAILLCRFLIVSTFISICLLFIGLVLSLSISLSVSLSLCNLIINKFQHTRT